MVMLDNDLPIAGPLSINPERRCTAHSSDGSGRRCKKAAMKGCRVCRAHGGSAPQVRAMARERLDALVLPAIKALRKAVKSNDMQATLRAAQIVLDRCGFGPKSELDISGSLGVEASNVSLEQLEPVTKHLMLMNLQGKTISKQLSDMIMQELSAIASGDSIDVEYKQIGNGRDVGQAEVGQDSPLTSPQECDIRARTIPLDVAAVGQEAENGACMQDAGHPWRDHLGRVTVLYALDVI